MGNHNQNVNWEKVDSYINALVSDIDGAFRELTPRGKGGKIKTNKPKEGCLAYVWRMCRFHCGDDMTMPVCADWDVSNGIQAATGEKVVFYLKDDSGKNWEVLRKLDDLADKVLDRVYGPLAKFNAARRYKGLLY